MLARRRRAPGPDRRLVGTLEVEGRESALADLALDVQLALHQLGEAAREHEPDAGALDRGAFGAEPVERLEQPGELLRAHADSGVLDEEPAALLVDLPAHPHAAARPVVLDRVAEEVDEDLAQTDTVRRNADLVFGERIVEPAALDSNQLQLDARLRCQRHDHREGIVGDGAKRHRLEPHGHLARNRRARGRARR